jgi:hypothetical protein
MWNKSWVEGKKGNNNNRKQERNQLGLILAKLQ